MIKCTGICRALRGIRHGCGENTGISPLANIFARSDLERAQVRLTRKMRTHAFALANAVSVSDTASKKEQSTLCSVLFL